MLLNFVWKRGCVAVKCDPCLLTEEQKNNRKVISQQLHKRVNEDETFRQKRVTQECWIYCYDIETVNRHRVLTNHLSFSKYRSFCFKVIELTVNTIKPSPSSVASFVCLILFTSQICLADSFLFPKLEYWWHQSKFVTYLRLFIWEINCTLNFRNLWYWIPSHHYNVYFGIFWYIFTWGWN